MKVKNSLRSLKSRHRDCRVVRRKGRVYVINKTQRRFKARQGSTVSGESRSMKDAEPRRKRGFRRLQLVSRRRWVQARAAALFKRLLDKVR